MKRRLPEENVYGHAKRLTFIYDAVARYSRETETARPTVLDVGCGTGLMITVPLAERGCDVTGLDLDEESIQEATRLAGDVNNPRFVCADVSDLDPAERFDVVVCSEVLEHLSDPADLLRKLKSTIAPAGIVIVTVPNGFGWFEFEQLLWRVLHVDDLHVLRVRVGVALRRRGLRAQTGDVEIVPRSSLSEAPHLQHFTLRRLRVLFTGCGLRIMSRAPSSLFAGRITHSFFGRAARFVRWNVRVVDRLPMTWASGWYFVLVADSDGSAN